MLEEAGRGRVVDGVGIGALRMRGRGPEEAGRGVVFRIRGGA